ncbi:nitroreductase/quinone reductase family protein [Nocardia sp. NPDC051463]|uniref:nitroreductase/quinone reductase family protein n=1 Tax=Nocardia sp. NPDC051463 TaxID=3154845 RepID=UPI0034510F56
MKFQKTPGGTHGARTPPMPAVVSRLMRRAMIGYHRRKGDKFMGMDVLYLTTVGAKTGEHRQTPLSYFHDGDDAWLIVASAAGAARHPAWYHNMAAHPDELTATIAGRPLRVTAAQLDGERYEHAWRQIIAAQPRYAGYQQRTDRILPIIRLTPADTPPESSTGEEAGSAAPD